MKIGIIGTGILGIQTALEVCSRTPDAEVFLIGKKDLPGTATNAAGAMLNSIAEIDNSTFRSKYGIFLSNLCEKATVEWDHFNKKYNHFNHSQSNCDLVNKGTYLINTSSGDFYEDRDFKRIKEYCDSTGNTAVEIDPKDVPGLNPINHSRTIKALYIPSEGFVDVNRLKQTIFQTLRSLNNFHWVDLNLSRFIYKGNIVQQLILGDGSKINVDKVVLCAGINSRQLLCSNPEIFNLVQPIFAGLGSTCRLKVDPLDQNKVIRTPNRGGACGIYTIPLLNDKNSDYNITIGASNRVTDTPSIYPRMGSIAHFMQTAIDTINMNFYKAEVVSLSTGWRPIAKDGYPLLGRIFDSNIILMTGTKRLGLHLSPLLANFSADLVLDDKDVLDIQKYFAPCRKPIYDLKMEESIELIVESLMSEQYQHGYNPSGPLMHEQFVKSCFENIEKGFSNIGLTEHGLPLDTFKLFLNGKVKV